MIDMLSTEARKKEVLGKYSQYSCIYVRMCTTELTTYWCKNVSKLRAPSDTEPSTNSSADFSPWLTCDKTSPEWNSEPVGLKFESIENFRIVFVTFSLFWKQKLAKSGEGTTENFILIELMMKQSLQFLRRHWHPQMRIHMKVTGSCQKKRRKKENP